MLNAVSTIELIQLSIAKMVLGHEKVLSVSFTLPGHRYALLNLKRRGDLAPYHRS